MEDILKKHFKKIELESKRIGQQLLNEIFDLDLPFPIKLGILVFVVRQVFVSVAKHNKPSRQVILDVVGKLLTQILDEI